MKTINNNCEHRDNYGQLRGLVDLLLSLPVEMKSMPMIEIGTFTGSSMEIFSLFFNHVYAVDPLGGTPDFCQDLVNRTEYMLDSIRRKSAGKIVTHIRLRSDEACLNFKDETIGMVYIDGNHSYEWCRRDILNYWPKIIPGGYLCGHDYTNADTPGVTRAVQELFGEPDEYFMDWSWKIKKIGGRMKS